jgi:CubicO group peptidase (beta-lactamase class C family)
MDFMTDSFIVRENLPAHGAITGLLTDLARTYSVPGLQFALYRNGEVSRFEFGAVRVDEKRPVTAETLFPLGSVTKFVTATLAMQLVSDGDVDLGEAIGRHVPELAGALDSAAAVATLGQLLSHTAGLPDVLDVEPEASLRRYVTAAIDAELVCVPGKVFSYSNLGYLIAGRAVEAVTGLSWWEAVQAYVLEPLEITGRTLGGDLPAGVLTGQHAVHLPTSSVQVVDQSRVPRAMVPAGALATTAAGLLRLVALQCANPDELVLEDEALQRMRQAADGAEAFGMADGWGLGLATFQDSTGGQWYGHEGNTSGATCVVRFSPDRDVAMVLMTNATSGRQMSNRFFAELLAIGWDVGAYRVADQGEPLSGQALQDIAGELTGEYRAGSDSVSVETRPGGEIWLHRGGLVPVRLTVFPSLAFQIGGNAASGGLSSDESVDIHRFIRDSGTGRVGGMHLNGARVLSKAGAGLLG